MQVPRNNHKTVNLNTPDVMYFYIYLYFDALYFYTFNIKSIFNTIFWNRISEFCMCLQINLSWYIFRNFPIPQQRKCHCFRIKIDFTCHN